MIEGLSNLLGSLSGRRILVIGDVMLDEYLEGTCNRVCHEAPAPIVELNSRVVGPGGAANVAANAAALGADVTLVGVIGDDLEGEELACRLEVTGVSANYLIRQAGRQTLAKRRVSAGGQILCRLDQGDTTALPEGAEAKFVRRLGAIWPGFDTIIISDYAYGMITPNVIAALVDLQQRSPRVVVGDSKRLAALREIGFTAVKPNYGQAVRLLGLEPDLDESRPEQVAKYGLPLLEVTGAQIIALTLDREGAFVFERDRPPHRTFAQPRPHCQASGAGDTYVATFALALAARVDTPVAAELAAAAASVVVAKHGTACCTLEELRGQLAGQIKVADREIVARRIAEKRAEGCRIVLTNGCFDILHRGHIQFLARAKALGDLLLVGVNTDVGIRRLKGPQRPINTLEDRLHVLSALGCVDYLVPFDENTPHELIRAIRPHIFVKGGDYTRERLPEARLVEELGGEVRILPFLADRSTTGLIERIRRANHAESSAVTTNGDHR